MSTEKDLMQKKLDSMISNKAQDINAVIQRIGATGTMIDDDVVNVSSIEFQNHCDRERVEIIYPDDTGAIIQSSIHDHALDHLGTKFGVPVGYVKRMAHGKAWEREVMAHTLSEFAENVSRERLLLRSVQGQVRAAVSDKYRRLNSMKILLTFLSAAQSTGSRLVDAHDGDTRSFAEVVLPEVVEFDTPQNGRNYGVFGARLRNSDFGHGALELSAYVKMVRCMNGWVGESLMREVHMGGKIPTSIEVSQVTVDKDTDARASLVQDAMKSIYSGNTRDEIIAKIQGASAKEIDIKAETERLPKLGLSKMEIEAFENLMLNNDPNNNLVGGPSMWKFTNGLTALARDSEAGRKRELEQIAGKLLGI